MVDVIRDLLAAIAAAVGPRDFPARIGTSATALRDLAAARLRARVFLRVVCDALRVPDAADDVDGNLKSFDANDARIIAYFLERSARRKVLE